LKFHVYNHRPISSPFTVDEIIEKCKDLAKKAEVSGFEHLHIPKVIDVYFFKDEFQEKVPKKHRVFLFQMPKTDEYSRVRGTIQEKAKQLHRGKPGIILIFDEFFWPSRKIAHFTAKLRHELEEKIFEFPELSAFVLILRYCDTSGDTRNILQENESAIAMRICNQKSIDVKYKVIIFNKYAKFPLSDEEKDILKKI
jgi:hypothetical protein